MSKKFSQIALSLIILANINPAMAASKEPNADLSTQKLNYGDNSNSIIVAGLFDNIRKITDTVERIDRTRDNIEQRNVQRRRLQERQAREEEKKRQQALEAERRRQYFESLSPEEQKAYLQKQQELRQRQAELMLNVFGALMSGDGGQSQGSSQQETWYYETTPGTTYNSTPTYTKPIDPFYGTCHHYSC